MISFNARSDR